MLVDYFTKYCSEGSFIDIMATTNNNSDILIVETDISRFQIVCPRRMPKLNDYGHRGKVVIDPEVNFKLEFSIKSYWTSRGNQYTLPEPSKSLASLAGLRCCWMLFVCL